jgi:hypothetical protein
MFELLLGDYLQSCHSIFLYNMVHFRVEEHESFNNALF